VRIVCRDQHGQVIDVLVSARRDAAADQTMQWPQLTPPAPDMDLVPRASRAAGRIPATII